MRTRILILQYVNAGLLRMGDRTFCAAALWARVDPRLQGPGSPDATHFTAPSSHTGSQRDTFRGTQLLSSLRDHHHCHVKVQAMPILLLRG